MAKFVGIKVTRTVSKILDVLKQRNLLLNKGPSDNRSSSERKPLDNRARVVQELVDTERKYVQDLETLQDYMRALEADEILQKDLIHILFANLNALVDFQRRFLIRVETQNDLPFEQQNWGTLFVEYVSFTWRVTMLDVFLNTILFSVGSQRNGSSRMETR